MAAANVLRELFVRLGVKVSPQTKQEVAEFDRSIEKIKGNLQDLGDFALTAGKWLGGALIAGATATGLLAIRTGEHAENVERQARALNLSRQEFQEFEHVFGTFGSDSKEISEAFLQLTQQADNAIHGQKAMVQSFQLIGLSVDQLKGKRPSELFEMVADAMKNTTNRQDALAAASSLFGEDTAKKMLPALVQGSAAIRGMRQEAHALGLVLTDEQLAASKQVSVQWRGLKNDARALGQTVGVILAPAVTDILERARDWIKANQQLISQKVDGWVRTLHEGLVRLDAIVQRFGGWDVVFANVATGVGLLTLIANLDKVEKLLKGIRLATTAAKVGLEALTGSAGVELAPVLIVVGLVTAAFTLWALAVDDLFTFWSGGKSVLGDVLDFLSRMIPGFQALRELWGALAHLVVTDAENFRAWGAAVRDGLAPAVDLANEILGTLGLNLENVWTWLDRIISSPIGWLTQLVRDTDTLAQRGGAISADRLQGAVGDAATAGVNFVRADGGNVDNRSSNVVANTTIHGAHAGDAAAHLEGAIRKAAPVVRGGRR